MRFSNLLRNADLALYHAKSQGKARLALFEPRLYSAAAERLSLERALHAAMDRGEFHLVYQPIVDLREQALVGVEALLRWQHPEFGNIPPEKFIHVAEETGLILALGRWVLETACRQAVLWTRQGLGGDKPISVTINISGRQLRDPEFEHTVARVLDHCGLPGNQLILELTESTVIDRPDMVLERLNALKRHGVRFAVDDFGTGYSALSYLQTFPIDVLKIDRSFVENVARGGSHTALAGAIVALGNALSLRTVAEGVESEPQRAHLRNIGCELGQGYLFAHPLTAAEIDARFSAASAA
jgi:EAL domain-containing protein (putative c-di-GMP-specific phosphodiesterase class I)